MKFLNLNKLPCEIEVAINFAEFMPNENFDENSIVSNAFFPSLKFEFLYYSKLHYSTTILTFTKFPQEHKIKINSVNEECINYLYLILNRINENSVEVIESIIPQRKSISFDDLQSEFDLYIIDTIRDESKNKKLQFLEIKREPFKIEVEFELQELSHLNVLYSFNFINSATVALQKQFENYHQSYCPSEEMNIEPQPHFVITGNNEKTLDYFIHLLNKVNQQSNYLYEHVLNGDTENLKEFFDSFLNTYIAKEILADQLPATSTINKKKNKV